MKVSAKDLRTRTRQLLEAVERGEEVVITYRGKARAKVVAIDNESVTLPERELFGIWSDCEQAQDVEHYLEELRRGRH